nr:nose resistant to fluoxetine protein 6-like [Rhipicephalus microplus]
MSILEDTLNDYYILPFYHGVCYFSGCIAFYLLQSFRDVKMSKITQALIWIVALTAGGSCVFGKEPWYKHRRPVTEVGDMCMAFFDRILWSLFLTWITLTCATGRGGKTFLPFEARFLMIARSSEPQMLKLFLLIA